MRKALTIVVPILLLGVAIAMRVHQKGQVAEAAKFEAHTMVEMLPNYAEHRQIYDDLVDSAHAIAFEEAFHMGGRRGRSRFDETQYFARVGELMIQHARMGGHHEIAEEIDRDWMIHPRPVAIAR